MEGESGGDKGDRNSREEEEIGNRRIVFVKR